MTTVADQMRELYERDDLPEGLRWIDSLSPRHQRLFYGEVQQEWSRYCLTNDARRLSEFFDDWKATAESDASPAHATYLLVEEANDAYEEWDSQAVG